MSFASGSVSFRRFSVVGDSPKAVEQSLLDKLIDHALKERDLGVPEEVEYGWSGGRHILDSSFTFEHNVFADCLFFGLRIDTNKVPGDLKKAYQMIEEDAVAAGNPSGFISKQQKRDVKDTVRRQVDDELRSGRFRRSKLVTLLWDVPNNIVYSTASGKSFEKLAEILTRSFGLDLQPMSSGTIALQHLEPRGRRRDYEDLRPSRFAHGPEGEHQYPEYPWVLKGPEPKDFVGNEFLLWLWHEADARSGVIKTGNAADGGVGDVTIYIDRSLDLDCAYGQTGRDSLRGDGPSKMPEARDALRSGKVPRKAGLLLHVNGIDYTINFNSETFGVSGGKLPDVEEADTPRTLFEERIALLRDLAKAIDALFNAFLKVRAATSWEGQLGQIRRWIVAITKQAVAAA